MLTARSVRGARELRPLGGLTALPVPQPSPSTLELLLQPLPEHRRTACIQGLEGTETALSRNVLQRFDHASANRNTALLLRAAFPHAEWLTLTRRCCLLCESLKSLYAEPVSTMNDFDIHLRFYCWLVEPS